MEPVDHFPLIGPHEGREFELMDRGVKHVALFYDIIPDDYVRYKALDDYDAIEWAQPISHPDGYDVNIAYRILFRKSHQKQAERLHQLQQMLHEGHYKLDHEYEVGAILGYPKAAIEYYVKRIKTKTKTRDQAD